MDAFCLFSMKCNDQIKLRSRVNNLKGFVEHQFIVRTEGHKGHRRTQQVCQSIRKNGLTGRLSGGGKKGYGFAALFLYEFCNLF